MMHNLLIVMIDLDQIYVYNCSTDHHNDPPTLIDGSVIRDILSCYISMDNEENAVYTRFKMLVRITKGLQNYLR